MADDVKAGGLQSLDERGFAPAVVLETSPANFQAVLKIPRNGATPFEPVNAMFMDLNRDLGDERITALTHGFRLAGFENRKDKHRNGDGQYPWVKLVSAVNQMCRKTCAAHTARSTPPSLGGNEPHRRSRCSCFFFFKSHRSPLALP